MATTVSLVLGSGGARGYAHIGVIEAVCKRGFEIVAIAGCSMGALVGGVYGAGKLAEYRRWVTGLSHFDVLRLLDLTFNGYGAIRGERIFAVLKEMVGDIRIEDLPIAYTAVATDLSRQKEVWFQEGELLAAMRASVAIPTLFAPVIRGDRVLVDGALLNPVPIVPTVSAHADLIIAVTLNKPMEASERRPERRAAYRDDHGLVDEWRADLAADASRARRLGSREGLRGDRSDRGGRMEMVYQSLEVMQNSLAQYKIAGYPPDLLIEVPKTSCRFYEFWRAAEMIEIGRRAADEVLERYARRRGVTR